MSNKAKNSRKEGLKEMKELMTSRHPMNPKNLGKDAALAGAAITAVTKSMKSPNPAVKTVAGASAAKIVGKKIIHDAKYVGDWVNAARKILFNHPEWYTKYGNLASTNLQWNLRKQRLPNEYIAAGMTLRYVITVPMQRGRVSSSYIDSINMIFAKLRGSNSGAYNYTPTELGDYIEAARSIYAVSASIARDIALLNNVDILAADSPDVILQVAGLGDAAITDLRANRANYIDRLNRMNLTISNLIPLPPNLAYLDRSIYMAQLALRDSETSKAVPILTSIKYALEVSNEGWVLAHVDVPAGIKERLDLLSQMVTLFNQYGGSNSYFSKIAGDLLKAYGNSAFRPYQELTINDKVTLTYDPYLLTQIQNSNTAGMQLEFQDYSMAHAIEMQYKAGVYVYGKTTANTPDKWKITTLPGTSVSVKSISTPILINNYKDTCTEGEALSLTRLCTFLDFDKEEYNVLDMAYAKVYDCGTEIITSTIFLAYHDSTEGGSTPYMSYVAKLLGGDNGVYNMIKEQDRLSMLWSQVDWAPTLYLYNQGAAVGPANYVDYTYKLMDLNMTALLTSDQFENFNEAATLSLLKTIDINDQINFRGSK